MKIVGTKLKGVCLVHLECLEDDRGFFARTWCAREFAGHGLNPRLVQCNTSFNKRAGTLRGLHYQTVPFPEAKLIRCTRGAVFDVAVDLRPDSPTFKQWFGVELREDTALSVYIGEGFAHGFQTLQDNSEVLYQMSEFYHPEAARGVRWDDPAFKIDWPRAANRILSTRDATYENFPC